MGHVGWGVAAPKMKYKTAHGQKGKSINRGHLKYLDSTFPSKFKGGPAGFAMPKSEKVLIDMNPEVYNINFPIPSRIPIGSLDWQRTSGHFQNTQLYLHKRAVREKNFGKG